MRSRRDFLSLSGAFALALAAAPGTARAEPAPPGAPAPRGPRYLLSLYLSGGIDAIFTTDPKTRAEVDDWVDVPYPAASIVEAGKLLLGPHFAPLRPFAPRMTVLQGVQMRTANHVTGAEQFLRMKTGTSPAMPTLLELIGERREGQAVGCLGWAFGAPQFQRLFRDTNPEDLMRMSAALRAQARALGGKSPRSAERASAARLDESAELLERMTRAPALREELWSADELEQSLARDLQRVLWAFENDLTRGFELNVGGVDQPWDSHIFNDERQAAASRAIPMIARFLGELERRSSPRGALAGETLVVMGSELGRFPAKNRQQGKDHFPEAPMVFFGAGIGRGVSLGRTGRAMQALAVSPATGREKSHGGERVSLDDVGASLLHLCGAADPRVYGYTGRVLGALVGE